MPGVHPLEQTGDSVFDEHVAVDSGYKACKLTQWKDADCLIALANAYHEIGNVDAAISAIDQAAALLQPGDKRLRKCKSMRDIFELNLKGGIRVEKTSVP